MDLENIEKLAGIVDRWVKNSQQMNQTSQKGDFYKALFDSNILGLVGSPNQAEFDVNSKAADKIFGLMDKSNFKGQINLGLSLDNKGVANLVVSSSPVNPSLATAVKGVFGPTVSAILKKLPPPAEPIFISDIVVAKNA